MYKQSFEKQLNKIQLHCQNIQNNQQQKSNFIRHNISENRIVMHNVFCAKQLWYKPQNCVLSLI